jgi:aspartyl-tRNA(Asn)/glutamyl-tRNA(Gln) amidotransferase subunit C
MSRISREEVQRIAHLARLRLAPDEAEAMTGDLDAILDYVEQLQSVDTRDVPPTSHVMSLPTPLREDRPGERLDPELALANAPARHDTAFAVPKVLEGEDEGS